MGLSDLDGQKLLESAFVEERVLEPAPVPPEAFALLHLGDIRVPFQPVVKRE